MKTYDIAFEPKDLILISVKAKNMNEAKKKAWAKFQKKAQKRSNYKVWADKND